MRLILYSKPGCHLCEGLQDKLEQVTEPPIELEIRTITDREAWFRRYQYEIPVLCLRLIGTDGAEIERSLPRCSPKATVQQLAQMLKKIESEARG